VPNDPTSGTELNLADALQRGIGLRLDRRFAAVHRRIYFALVVLIIVLTAMGMTLWFELRHIQADVARTRAEADAIKERADDQKVRLGRLAEKFQSYALKSEPENRQTADHASRLSKLDEKLDRNLAETARVIQGVADQGTQLEKLAEKLDKDFAKSQRSVTESKLPITQPKSAFPLAAMNLTAEERQVIREFFGVRQKEDATRFDAKVGEIAPVSAPLYPVPNLLYEQVPKLKDHRFFADEVTGTVVIVSPFDNRVVAIV
jgi:hypothetical protein